MANFGNRIIRAAKLDVSLYEEVEADKSSLGQAMGVVVLSSVAAGIGNTRTQAGLLGMLLMIVVALVGWYIWAYLTYFIGTKLLPEPQTKADLGELLRTTGFSSSPGLIRVLGVIPVLQGIVFPIAGIWMLVAMVIAVRQALDYSSTLRAVGVCLIGFIIQIVLFGLLFYMLGGFSGAAAGDYVPTVVEGWCRFHFFYISLPFVFPQVLYLFPNHQDMISASIAAYIRRSA